MSARRILLVDDSSTMRRMLSTLLADQGYEVKTAVDGNDGLAKAREDPVPELILSDFEMPELDGPGLCRAVKSDPELRTIPVLMLTTLGETKSKVAGLDAGADDYIQKPKSPGDIEELFARIRAHFRTRRHEPELAERNRLLEAAHKKLQFELDLARKVQRGLMPRPPRPRGVLQAAVKYTPANQLGGDVYDFYRLENNRLGVLVADVSGHGVNSAMLSGMVKALAAGLSIAVLEPGELLAGLDVVARAVFPRGLLLHRVLPDRGRGDGPDPVTPASATRRRSSSGRTGRGRSSRTRGMLGVGMVDGTAGAVDRIGPGESLVIYTDGLPDAMDPSDVLFGEERLKTVLQSHYGADPGGDPRRGREGRRQAHVPRLGRRRHQHGRAPESQEVIRGRRAQGGRTMRAIAIGIMAACSSVAVQGQEKGASPNARNPSTEPLVVVWYSGMDDQAEENFTGKRVNREAIAILREVYGRRIVPGNIAADSQGGLALFLTEVDGCDHLPKLVRGSNLVAIRFYPDGVDPMHVCFMATEALLLPPDLAPATMKAEIGAYLARNLSPPPERTVLVKYRSKVVAASKGGK